MAKVPPYHTDFEEHPGSTETCTTTTTIVRMEHSSFCTIVSPVPEVSPNVRNARR